MRTPQGAISLLALMVVRCGPNIRTTPLTTVYPQLPADAEVLVSSQGLPECDFEELGLVTVRESFGVTGPAVLETMKREARKLGGHALIGLRDVLGRCWLGRSRVDRRGVRGGIGRDGPWIDGLGIGIQKSRLIEGNDQAGRGADKRADCRE